MELPTTLLRHEPPGHTVGPHFDWLIVDPLARRDPGVGLWTVRVGYHWLDWVRLGRFDLTPLPRHRRRYLSWAGQLSDHRGWVRQAGRGRVVADLWTPQRIELTLTPDAAAGQTDPIRLSLGFTGLVWRGVVLVETA